MGYFIRSPFYLCHSRRLFKFQFLISESITRETLENRRRKLTTLHFIIRFNLILFYLIAKSIISIAFHTENKCINRILFPFFHYTTKERKTAKNEILLILCFREPFFHFIFILRTLCTYTILSLIKYLKDLQKNRT